jgi:hypothetical protein
MTLDSGQLYQLFRTGSNDTVARRRSAFEGRRPRWALHPRIDIGEPSGPLLKISNGEFDPGSGRTLAARLTHASRGRTGLRSGETGERVSNT